MACVSNHYGRVEACPCSDLMTHVRGIDMAESPPMDRWKSENTHAIDMASGRSRNASRPYRKYGLGSGRIG